MKIHYRIQHAEGRDEPLRRVLSALPLAEVVTDAGPPPPNPWRGYLLCLQALPDCSHVVILQDDVLLCPDFADRVAEAVEEKPENVISLFVAGLKGNTLRQYRQTLIRGEHWCPVYLHGGVPAHVVGLVWPVALADSFREWALSAKIPGLRPPYRSDDAVFSAWAKLNRQQIWATVPSLVQHDDAFGSTIGRPLGGEGRRAIAFLG